MELLNLLLIRAGLIWTGIVALAILNGAFRELVIAKLAPPRRARRTSGILLGILITGWTFLTIPWIAPADLGEALGTGLFWLGLTVAFEFSFGRYVAKKSWRELLDAYRCREGDLWPVVLFVVFLAPTVTGALRSVL